MSQAFYHDGHKEDEFIALAERCGIKGIIDRYRHLGLVFCYYDGPAKGGSLYDRTPETIMHSNLNQGVVYISSREVYTHGLSQEGFTMLALHEIGHYEGFRRRLNGGAERVARELADELARTIYQDRLPDWWTRVRREQ